MPPPAPPATAWSRRARISPHSTPRSMPTAPAKPPQLPRAKAGGHAVARRRNGSRTWPAAPPRSIPKPKRSRMPLTKLPAPSAAPPLPSRKPAPSPTPRSPPNAPPKQRCANARPRPHASAKPCPPRGRTVPGPPRAPKIRNCAASKWAVSRANALNARHRYCPKNWGSRPVRSRTRRPNPSGSKP